MRIPPRPYDRTILQVIIMPAATVQRVRANPHEIAQQPIVTPGVSAHRVGSEGNQRLHRQPVQVHRYHHTRNSMPGVNPR